MRNEIDERSIMRDESMNSGFFRIGFAACCEARLCLAV